MASKIPTLTNAQIMGIRIMTDRVNARIGNTVVVEFVKANGERSTINGKAIGINGCEAKRVVIVETDKGFRSASLYSIVSFATA